MMYALYMIILLASAALASWGGGRILARVGKELGLSTAVPQLAVSLAIIAFLLVVSMPAGILIGMLFLLAAPLLPRGQIWLRAAALLSGLLGVAEATGGWPAPLPEAVGFALAALTMAGLLAVADRHALPVRRFGMIILAGMLPLIVAPLLYKTAHTSLALDALLIGAAVLGGMPGHGKGEPAAVFLRLPVVLALGYGMVQAVRYGAWPLALASLLITLAGLVSGRERA